jgi:hypothetical protein
MTDMPVMSDPVLMVKLDRRRNRLALPRCPECAREEPRVLMRTDFVLYLRAAHVAPCGACGSRDPQG